MKKIWFIAFVFNLHFCILNAGQLLIPPFVELYGSYNLNKDFDNGALINGIKLEWNILSGSFFTNYNDYIYGIDFNTNKIFPKFPFFVDFKVGNLQASGSISKLNSPVLYSVPSGFSKSISNANGILASLPDYNSFSKSPSFFLQTTYKNPNLKKNSFSLRNINLNIFCYPQYLEEISDTSAIGISINSKLNISSSQKLDFSSTNGYFSYKSANLTSWFNEIPYYSQDNHFCNSNQITFTSPHFSTFFMANFYQNPFEKIDFIFRNENKFKIKNYSILFSEYINPVENIITSSDKKLKAELALKTSLQKDFIIAAKNPLFSTLGIASYFNTTLYNTDKSLKNVIGLKVNGNSFGGTYSMNINLKKTDQTFNFTELSFYSKNSFYFNKLNFFFNCGFYLFPDSDYKSFKTTEKFSLNFSVPSKYYVLNTNTFSFNQKTEGVYDYNYSFALSTRLYFKYLLCNFKLTWQFSGNE